MHRRRKANPYASLQALLDTTRELDPQEMAELQLELGYVERALRIYEELLLSDPRNGHYRRRCEWLARLATASPRKIRSVGRARPTPTPRRAARRRTTTRPGRSSEPPRSTPIRPLRTIPIG